jgi:hypothetical protein
VLPVMPHTWMCPLLCWRQVDKGLVGDPVERAAVEATGWVCKQETVSSPGGSSGGGKETNKVRLLPAALEARLMLPRCHRLSPLSHLPCLHYGHSALPTGVGNLPPAPVLADHAPFLLQQHLYGSSHLTTPNLLPCRSCTASTSAACSSA